MARPERRTRRQGAAPKKRPLRSAATVDVANPPPVTLEQALLGAQNMQRHGLLDKAEAVYVAVLERLPDEPNALHYLGILRHQQGRHSDAIALIRRAIALVPNEPGPWINLGNVFLEAQQFDDAVDAYKAASELAPANLLVYNNLGLLQARRNNFELAEAAYRHALVIAPDAAYVLHNYAAMLQRQGRYEEATAYSLKTLTIAPEDPKAHRLLSISYALVGDFNSAQGVLRAWLANDPGNPEATHLLAAVGGLPTPVRASDAYIAEEFDSFSKSFDAKLELLGYRAPTLVTEALSEALGPGRSAGVVLDAGCGTGLCAIPLRPLAARLVGVDLSRGMLDKATARGGYDSLHHAELTAFIESHPERWDCIVSADTLCYFGELEAVLRACAGAMQADGLLAFSLEAHLAEAPGYVLQHNGRYCHARAYVEQCIDSAGLELVSLKQETLRMEVMRPVLGWILVARSRAPTD